MQNIIDYIEEVNDTARRLVNEMEMVRADQIGLDIRAGHRLWINEDCIVVTKAGDRSLQYYGGFEYVDKEYRTELGDFVVYMTDDGRVSDHIDTWMNANTKTENEPRSKAND